MKNDLEKNMRNWTKICLAAALAVWTFAGLGIADAGAQARRAKVPYEYTAFEGTNWVTMFDGKSLTGWIPLELGGSGPTEFEADFVPDKTPDAKPTPILRVNRGDMLSGMAWTNGPVRMNYEIEWEAMRVDGNDFFAAMSFPVKEDYVTFIPSGWGGSVGGISSVDDHDASENETSSFLSLDDQKWYKFKVRVTEKKIECWVDEKRIVNLLTEGKKLGLRPGSPSEIKRYGIVCTAYRTTGAIRSIKMRKIDPGEKTAEKK
ncbi:MAG: DUF1080 domain-containing protein [Verrucomicrobia bacterium]|nr:DUF1080 domain-containing protein [Verrucomicrobiota bacterium]